MNRSRYDACPRCHHYVWDGVCKCVKFSVAIPWCGKVEDEDWRTQYALDAEAAVEDWAERHDCASGDYTIITNGGADEVWCRDAAGAITVWTVEARQVAEYHAREKRTANPTPESRPNWKRCADVCHEREYCCHPEDCKAGSD